MLHWAGNMYVSDSLIGKEKKIMRKAALGMGMLGVSFITLAMDRGNLLDIFSAPLLKQRAFRRQELYFVGMAADEGEARQLAMQIIDDLYRTTGGFDVKAYFGYKE